MQPPSVPAGGPHIEFLTPAAEVSMSDNWFDIAGISHFWIKGRFRVLKKLAPPSFWTGAKIAEFGCGNGCVQRQLEDLHGIGVDGFDLNTGALSESVARQSRLFCYDAFTRKPELAASYDVIILFDVLEHIADEKGFLDAILFHLKPGGRMLVNMPADMRAYSVYDKVVGHIRRYDRQGLAAIAQDHGLTLDAWSYWGAFLYPLLLARKCLLRPGLSEKQVIEKGFRPPGQLSEKILGGLLAAEPLPNHLFGTSIMGLYSKSLA
jgi:SAM-dependent methyltransferase